MVQMDEKVKKMQALHDKMMSAKSSEERQRWMDEQHKAIEEGMRMMTQMMQDPAMNGGRMRQQGSAADADAQMQLMQKGIEMMTIMTQTMMDQLGTMRGRGGSDSEPKK